MTRAEAYRQVIAEGAERDVWRTLRQGEPEAALRARYADYTYRQELNLAAHTARESLARAVAALPMDRAATHDSSATDLRSVRRARFNLAGCIGWVRTLRREIQITEELARAAPVWVPVQITKRRKGVPA